MRGLRLGDEAAANGSVPNPGHCLPLVTSAVTAGRERHFNGLNNERDAGTARNGANEREVKAMDRFWRMMSGIRVLAVLATMMVCAPFATAQTEDLAPPTDLFQFDLAPARTSKASAAVTASLVEDSAKPGEAVLAVTVTISGAGNTYGMDATSPKKTEITVKLKAGYTEIGNGFEPDHPPKVSFDKNFDKDVGKYTDAVTFSRRIKIDASADRSAPVTGTIDFLFCDANNCIPKTEKFSASLAKASGKAPTPAPAVTDDLPPPAETVPAPTAEASNPLAFGYQVAPKFNGLPAAAGNPVMAIFELKPSDAKPGETVTLSVKLKLNDIWHTYSMRQGKGVFGFTTLIDLDRVEGLEAVGTIEESPKPEEKPVGTDTAYIFHEQVVWTQSFKRVGTAPLSLAGLLHFAVCEKENCLPPKKVKFALGRAQTAAILMGATRIDAASLPSMPEKPKERSVGTGSETTAASTSFEVDHDAESTTLWGALFFAFIGGLTLNIMPCVLPVLAIKILSIVQQAGESRGRILIMNVVYALGVISVFAVLATLAAVFRMGWGQQFQQEWFRVATVLVVFVCGLNLLGVFEVLLPGMLSQVAGGGEHREGLLGAFMTGIFATLLATPCSTGYMTYALAWSVKQPTPVIYLVWCTMGLGMALPYLLIGIYPRLINWLPRPGMWMVRFKQLSAFAMFGAAVWFLIAIDQRNVLPVLTACVGLSLGLWMIGSLYDRESPLRRKTIVRLTALGSTWAICTIAFWMHTAATAPPPESELPWVAFNENKLLELRKAGKPILIDFTADWCAICKQNEHLALNTINTADFVNKHGITTMVADFTNQDKEIEKWLNQFQSISVPLLVIVPPNPSAKVILLTGPYSETKLLRTLEKAMEQKDPASGENAVVADAAGKMVMSETAAPQK
jgi:suppressor for copper-sensitivity B